MFKRIALFLFVSLFFNELSAQKVGLGAQFGSPTGISLRINNGSAMHYDILAAWDVDDYFFFNLHGLWEHSLAESPTIHYYYGLGVFAGFRERGRWKEDDVFIGFSGTLGINLYIKRLEFFAQITPRLALVPGTDGHFGGGVGARFYLN